MESVIGRISFLTFVKSSTLSKPPIGVDFGFGFSWTPDVDVISGDDSIALPKSDFLNYFTKFPYKNTNSVWDAKTNVVEIKTN